MQRIIYQEVELYVDQRLGKVHSLYVDKEAWLQGELRGRSKPEVREDEDETTSENVNSKQEYDYPTEERKIKFQAKQK